MKALINKPAARRAALAMALFVTVLAAAGAFLSVGEENMRARQTLNDAEVLGARVDELRREHPGDPCPVLGTTGNAGGRKLRVVDAWKREFRIECVDGGVQVISRGADGRFGTDDDLAVGTERDPRP